MKKQLVRSTGLLAAVLFSFNVSVQAQPGGVPQSSGLPQKFPKSNPVALTTSLSSEIKPLPVLAAMQRVADWQLAHPSAHKTTDWTQGAGDAGMMALAGISGDAKYRDAMLALGETNDWKPGPRFYDADDHCVGQTWAELYFLYRAPKMIAPLREKFDAILTKPSAVTSLAFDKAGNPNARENWSWCDSLFMGPSAWVRLYAATGDEKYLNFAVKEWWRTTDYLYDKDEHLFFRDSTYFKKTEANGKKVFWGRGNGWVMGGLVRTLQYLPMNSVAATPSSQSSGNGDGASPPRARFEQLFKDMSAKILTCQQPDGLWRASLLDPDSYPLKETSGSGFFAYALAWGVNQGLLDRAQFEPVVRKAWTALVGCVDADGKLTHVQPIGADPKKFAEDDTEVYGVGAFLLAGSEVYRLALLQIPIAVGDTNTIINGENVFPLVQFDKVPVTFAVEHLAKQAGTEYVFDPNLNYNRVDANGVTNEGPLIMVRWTNVAAHKALELTVANCGLEAVYDSTKNSYYITKAKQNIRHPSSRIIVKVTNPADFYRESETVELNDQILSSWAPGFFQDLFQNKFAVMVSLSSRILDSQICSSD